METSRRQIAVAGGENEVSLKAMLQLLLSNCGGGKGAISLGLGDPTAHSCFATAFTSTDAVSDALFSWKFNGYAPTAGLTQTREAIAEYLSRDLPEKLSHEDVYITAGCTQAIELCVSILTRRDANILLPRPGFPIYGLCASFRGLEARYFDLDPKRGWEVDLNCVQRLADSNTVAMVIINPGNPCGNVYGYDHLKEIAETARKLGITVISDEVYGHLTFGMTPFVSMGTFGDVAPVITLGSMSKRWLVPGWRLGWLAIHDSHATLKTNQFVARLKKYTNICGGPATFIQAAVPTIIEERQEVFFRKTLNLLEKAAEFCYEKIEKIDGLTCSYKPQGSMMFMVKVNVSELKDIHDDVDFCFKLAREESLIILPGSIVGLKDWIRISFAVDMKSLEEAMERLESFCKRHSP